MKLNPVIPCLLAIALAGFSFTAPSAAQSNKKEKPAANKAAPKKAPPKSEPAAEEEPEEELTAAQKVQKAVIAALKKATEAGEGGDVDGAFSGLAKSGATPQQILEAKLLHITLNDGDPKYLDSFKADLDKAAGDWKAAEKLVYTHGGQVLAAVHYVAAIKASDAGDEAAFQKEILEAIWGDPDQEKYMEALKERKPSNVKLDLAMKLIGTDGKTSTLGDALKGKKALYVQVWATWCGPCIRLLPVLTERNKDLPPQGIGVIALNSELGQEADGGGNKAKAKSTLAKESIKVPCLVEPPGSPIVEALGIDSVPRALIIDPDGRVVFNAHPIDARLATILKKYDIPDFDVNAGLPKEDE